LEASRDEAWTTLQLLIRHRRDLVRKGAWGPIWRSAS
jgi:hypothetical protein